MKDESHPEATTRVDWAFTVWNPEAWYRLYNNPKSFFAADQPNFRQPVAPPRLDLYVGGGGVDWSQVKAPPNVRVRDERASAAGIPPRAGAVVRADVFDIATGKPVAGTLVTVARMLGGGQDRHRAQRRVESWHLGRRRGSGCRGPL